MLKVFGTSPVRCGEGVVTKRIIGPLGTAIILQPSDDLVAGAYSAENLHR
jgi:hypothetical protein